MSWIAMDIGGANIKLADGYGFAESVGFALWQHPQRLADELRTSLATAPACDHLAVTMTGELADCFSSKAEGIQFILDAVADAADGRHTRVYLTDGTFVVPSVAVARPLMAASSNWHALARYCGRYAPAGRALLLDVGSTTTDILPLRDGAPAGVGHTDTQRLLAGELVYSGVERSPVCALVQDAGYRGKRCRVAQEVFSTTRDVYLVLGDCAEDLHDFGTADHRPATRADACRRLGRMLCADLDQFQWNDALALAGEVSGATGSAGPGGRGSVGTRRRPDRHRNSVRPRRVSRPSPGRSAGTGWLSGFSVGTSEPGRLALCACARGGRPRSRDRGAAMNGRRGVRVIKVGGSLLQWPQVAPAMRRWLGEQPAMTSLVVTGGGALADEVRQMDRRFRLAVETSHRLAVETMAVYAHLLSALLPEARRVALSQSHPHYESLDDGGLWIVEPIDFVQRVQSEAAGRALPVGWHVTSDSIAARLAELFDATELVLLKSTLPAMPGGATRQSATVAGLVDPYFPESSRGFASRPRRESARCRVWRMRVALRGEDPRDTQSGRSDPPPRLPTGLVLANARDGAEALVLRAVSYT